MDVAILIQKPIFSSPARLLLAFACLLSLSACSLFQQDQQPVLSTSPQPIATGLPTTPQTIVTSLATPVSDSPASGICEARPGDVVTVTLTADIPVPRCLEITAEQHIGLQNSTGQALLFTFGPYSGELAPGDNAVLEAASGTFLASGVHRVVITAGFANGPELWLK